MPAVKSRLSFITPKPLKPDHPLFVFLPGMDGTGQLLHNQADTLEKSFDIRCLAIPPDDLNDWDSLANHFLGNWFGQAIATSPFGSQSALNAATAIASARAFGSGFVTLLKPAIARSWALRISSVRLKSAL